MFFFFCLLYGRERTHVDIIRVLHTGRRSLSSCVFLVLLCWTSFKLLSISICYVCCTTGDAKRPRRFRPSFVKAAILSSSTGDEKERKGHNTVVAFNYLFHFTCLYRFDVRKYHARNREKCRPADFGQKLSLLVVSTLFLFCFFCLNGFDDS